ncbi:MAG: single-stranded DNA-binding protein [Clostridium sp.]|uniref:single-stranded DNA-binding protein n=1 Tax=Clostridium sp. TaxID=1506 RepID=UPI003F4085C3
MNSVFLIGRLTRDPELRFTAGSGLAVTRFTLAVNRIKKKDAEEKSDFIGCVAFNKTAELISQYMSKGRKIAVEGRIQTSSYEKEGIKHYTMEIVINRCEFIEYAKEISDSKNIQIEHMTPVDDGDMPF